MKAWVYQDAHQVEKHGTEKASWYVGWVDPDGRRKCKSFGPGAKGKKLADQEAQRVTVELTAGTYDRPDKKLWKDFRWEYEQRSLAGLAPATALAAKKSLDAFERLIKPGPVSRITSATVADFITKRRADPGKKSGQAVSPHTINRDLRHLKAALRLAHEWGYLPKVPKFRMERAVKQLPRFVTGEHFTAIYQAADTARFPSGNRYEAGDWWRALLTMAYMTGWRIGALLGLRREDLDLTAGVAITRGDVNKGKRDERVKLHPVVVEHLKKIVSFDPVVFSWPHDRRTLYTIFAEIQESAGIDLPCRGLHDHTPACHVYGFHDLRRAFATMNAAKLTPEALQTLMGHKDYQTTRVYINYANQIDKAVESLHVPEVLRAGIGS